MAGYSKAEAVAFLVVATMAIVVVAMDVVFWRAVV